MRCSSSSTGRCKKKPRTCGSASGKHAKDIVCWHARVDRLLRNLTPAHTCRQTEEEKRAFESKYLQAQAQIAPLEQSLRQQYNEFQQAKAAMQACGARFPAMLRLMLAVI